MIRSWQAKIIALLVAILVSAGVFLAWTSYNYAYAIRRTVAEKNAASAHLWRSMLESRATAMDQHVRELLITLFNNTSILSGTPEMDIKLRTTILDMMKDKLLVNKDVDAFFVVDGENGLYLIPAASGLSVKNVFALKRFVHSEAVARAKPFRSGTWSLVNVDGTDYLFNDIQLGKYTVGAFSSCGRYNIGEEFSILGEEYGCFLRTEGGTFYCGGNPKLAGRLEGIVPGYSAGWIAEIGRLPFLDAETILLARPGTMFGAGGSIPFLLFLDSAVCVTLVITLLVLLRRDVARPTRELAQANDALAAGQIEYRLEPEKAGSAEFQALFESFNSMADQIVELRIDAYDLKLKEEQERLTMLRAQLKPHSFLNVINTISSMTYASRMEDIRAYTGAFAKFVRYMLNASTAWVTVAQELNHVRNYIDMQRMRFPDSIRATVECDEEAAEREIPFLVLFTLVENAFKHAMTLYEPLELRIACVPLVEDGFDGILLTVEDSGSGFSEEVLQKLSEAGEQSPYAKEHLGLSNVRCTLNLLYHRDDLLRVGNRPEGGARVEVRIPNKEAAA